MSIKFTDEIAKLILHEPVNFKLSLAHHHLLQIPSSMQQDYNMNHFFYEAHIESFLIFCTMAIDSLCFQLAGFLNYDINNEKFTIYSIRNQLRDSQINSHQNIVELINQHFEYPKQILETSSELEFTISKNHDYFSSSTNYLISISREGSTYVKKGWDLRHSMLWLMRELRNSVAHKPLLGRALVPGTQNPVMMLIYAKWSNQNSKHTMSRGYRNPGVMCKKFFEELQLFVDKMSEIIGTNNHSSLYRNQLDFEL